MRASQQDVRFQPRGLFRLAGLVVFLGILIGFAFGQHRAQTTVASAARDNGIVRGTVVAATPAAIEVRDEKGAVHRVAVDDDTLVLSDDKDFSVANLPDIELSVSDLAKGDIVEVVVEPAKDRTVAGIVTRMSPIGATATARREPR